MREGEERGEEIKKKEEFCKEKIESRGEGERGKEINKMFFFLLYFFKASQIKRFGKRR